MTYQQILAELQQKKFRPVYFLAGSEPYFIDAISDFIEENALEEHEKPFNQVIVYGQDANHLTIVDHARKYPMMAQRQVVIVKEAQEMKDLKDLEKYIEKPSPTTVLVLCHKHKPFNKTSKFAKTVKEHAVLFEGTKLYDNQVPDWIADHLRTLRLKISPATANLIAEYLGTDLSLIVHELEKLSIHLSPGSEVTAKHVEDHIGISREYNVFELQKAMATKDMPKMARIMANFLENPKKNPFIMIVSSLAGYFTKVYMLHFLKNKQDQDVLTALNLRSAFALKEYRAAANHYPLAKTEEVIGLLKQYDLMAKGVDFNTTGKDEGALLKELIFRILH